MEKQEYMVEVEEILQTLIPIEATSKEEAIEIARNMYRYCDIILETDDLKETNFRIYED